MTAAAEAGSGRRGEALGYLLAILGVLAFSTRPVLIRLGYAEGVDAETLLALRMGLSLPFFVAMWAWSRRRAAGPLAPGDLLRTAALGMLGYWIASYCDFLGLRTVPAGLGRIILFLYPTFVLALSALLLGRRPQRREILCLLVAYAGLALVLDASAAGFDAARLGGAGLILLSALAYAGYLVGGSSTVPRIGSTRFTAIAMMTACVACIAQFFALRPAGHLLVSGRVLGIAAWIAVIGTVLPVWATSEALKRIGATRAALLGALGPVSTILLAWAGMDEAMTGPQIVGAVLVLGGVGLLSLPRRRPAEAKTAGR